MGFVDNQPDDFDWNWMTNYFSRLDTFQAQHPGQRAMNKFGVARWALGASNFMRDQMNYLEQRGMNYAVWVWDSGWEPWRTWGSKAMNYLFGPDPNNYTEVPNALMNEILQAWSRNTIRPSLRISARRRPNDFRQGRTAVRRQKQNKEPGTCNSRDTQSSARRLRSQWR